MVRYIIIGIGMLLLCSCKGEIDPVYRDSMREFVGEISAYSKAEHSGFIVIPQNGHELVSVSGDATKNDPHSEYLAAIDGAGQEDLYYGYSKDDRATDEDDTEYLLDFLKMCEENDVEVLVTDYCSTKENIDNSYEINHANGFISFAADERELKNIPAYPDVYLSNNKNILTLEDAENFLYLINPESYKSKQEFLNSIAETNYDAVILDLFYNEIALTRNDLSQIKTKNDGGSRLLICYMSIGEAEDYRYYWKDEWSDNPPSWLDKENPKWEGNYKVQYWDPDWKLIIYGTSESYLDRIISAGFDGVYLDIIEAFEYFE